MRLGKGEETKTEARGGIQSETCKTGTGTGTETGVGTTIAMATGGQIDTEITRTAIGETDTGIETGMRIDLGGPKVTEIANEIGIGIGTGRGIERVIGIVIVITNAIENTDVETIDQEMGTVRESTTGILVLPPRPTLVLSPQGHPAAVRPTQQRQSPSPLHLLLPVLAPVPVPALALHPAQPLVVPKNYHSTKNHPETPATATVHGIRWKKWKKPRKSDCRGESAAKCPLGSEVPKSKE